MIKLIISAGMPALVVNNVFGNLDLAALDRPLLQMPKAKRQSLIE